MQSNFNSIPIPHRQQRDGVYVPAPLSTTPHHGPHLTNADYNDLNPSYSFDDDAWGVFDIDIDDDPSPSFPPGSGTYEFTRPPVLPSDIQYSFQPGMRDGAKSQPAWEVSSNLVPSRPFVMNQNGLRIPDVPQTPLSYSEVWAGSNLHTGQPLNSPISPHTAASFFSEHESLRLSRIPSLVTNASLGNPSWESPSDMPVPEIYGASQWAGLSSFPFPHKPCEAGDTTEPTAVAQQNPAPDGRSSGMESQCGTSSINTNENGGVQVASWFDYGNKVTQHQGVPNFVEHIPSFQSDMNISNFNSAEIQTDFQLFGENVESHAVSGFGINYDTQQAPMTLNPFSPSLSMSNSMMQYNPHPALPMSLIPSSQGVMGYSPQSASSPISPVSLHQAFQMPSHEILSDFNYSDTVNEMNHQSLAPFLCQQPAQVSGLCGSHDATEGDAMEGIEENSRFFVMENGYGRAVTPPLAREKGKRGGHLNPEAALIIATKRKEGKTCLRCKIARTTCDGQNPCGRCARLGEPAMLKSPCIRANFVEIVKSGTCNYISQRTINHFNLQETYRVKMVLPETFDVNECLGLLNSRKRRFNIRARQASGSLYVLDLAECYNFLNRLPGTSSNGGLRTFIDDTLVKKDSWHKCVKEVDPNKNKTLLLSKWNNMPSRVSYDLVPLDKSVPERPLDPEDEDDRHEILLAAQLSRIICRKLELSGYAALQAIINNTRSNNTTFPQRLTMLHQFGKILLSLRWRMAWWKMLGDGSGEGDVYRDRFVQRVEELTRTLYFYYFAMRRGVGAWVEMNGLEGVVSMYPDAEPIWEDLPVVQSVEGFEAWLARGRGLIREANVERRFSV